MGSNCLRNFRIKESRPVFMHVKSLGLYLPLYVYIRFKDSSLGGEPLCWPFTTKAKDIVFRFIIEYSGILAPP
jgi:hypothetical protein